jgi:hypothetical protein
MYSLWVDVVIGMWCSLGGCRYPFQVVKPSKRARSLLCMQRNITKLEQKKHYTLSDY